MKLTLVCSVIFILLCLTGCKKNSSDLPIVKQESKKIIHPFAEAKENPVTKSVVKTLEGFAKHNGTYESTKAAIQDRKATLSNADFDIDSVGYTFKTSLLNKIIPYWSGTPWSFEGHSSTPQEGTIACGYFVSTTLKHAGLNLNRYKLAQQRPLNEAKSLAINSTVLNISENTNSQNIDVIRQKVPEGIHFIGFDESHVGFIVKDQDDLYLIHSNYLGMKGVELEKIEDSEVFASYNRFYISELSTNKTLLKHWHSGKEIHVFVE